MSAGSPTGGTKLTVEVCRRLSKPYLVMDLGDEPDATAVVDWLKATAASVLNVAGPRASGAPGVHGKAAAFLRVVLSAMRAC